MGIAGSVCVWAGGGGARRGLMGKCRKPGGVCGDSRNQGGRGGWMGLGGRVPVTRKVGGVKGDHQNWGWPSWAIAVCVVIC